MPMPSAFRRTTCSLYAILVMVAAVLGLMAGSSTAAAAQEPWRVGDWTFTTNTFAGNPGDRLTGSAIQSDGTIVLVGRITGGPLVARVATLQAGPAVVVRLSEDGRRVLSATRIGPDVRDVAIDDRDNIYVALGGEGVAKLDPAGRRPIWQRPTEGICTRVAVTPNGTVAALRYDRDVDSTPGNGTIYLFDANGRAMTRFRGHRHTLDIAIDQESRTVVLIGWRQANAFDGSRTFPVQIAYMRGVGFDGQTKYTLYDWSTDRNAPNFLNRPTNNMADTRGYRIAMGRDGKVYSGFEAAGGNHIFRYEPQLRNGNWASATGKKPRGDQFFEWHNSRSEHKLFVACHDPATGEYLLGQQFAGRLDTGRTNTVRMVDGALATDENGRVLAGGAAGAGLPLMFTPPETGDYTGGGYILLLGPGMTSREVMTRLDPGGRVVSGDIRRVGDTSRIIVTGHVRSEGDISFTPYQALQDRGAANVPFFTVLHEKPAN
ncbi:MAG: hypothetical protein JJU36_15065 [Phycisphaeraceae bacterium]|nr:hypothetical protein [Phycisphaeraceae bacterium]